MNIYKETLPKIQSVRNHGFTGSALYSIKAKPNLLNNGSPIKTSMEGTNKKKFQKRTFLPVNHFITNHNINININNNYNYNINLTPHKDKDKSGEGSPNIIDKKLKDPLIVRQKSLDDYSFEASSHAASPLRKQRNKTYKRTETINKTEVNLELPQTETKALQEPRIQKKKTFVKQPSVQPNIIYNY